MQGKYPGNRAQLEASKTASGSVQFLQMAVFAGGARVPACWTVDWTASQDPRITVRRAVYVHSDTGLDCLLFTQTQARWRHTSHDGYSWVYTCRW
jgi:hypothetical protein